MSRRRPHPHSTAPGSDSFLDIVANMVGILIILVMVVGVQAKDAFLAEPISAAQAEEEETDAGNEPDESSAAALAADLAEDELQEKRRKVYALKSEVDQLATTTGEVAEEARSRFELRQQLQQLVVSAEELIQQERSKLDETGQKNFDLRRQLQAARDELEDLSTARIAVENTAAPVVEIKHLPTPMAKTVWGREEHFRLAGGRLVYVPMNDLVDEMKEQARLKLYKLENASEITEIVGPIGGFSMKYRLVRRNVAVNTGGGAAVRQAVDLANFVLVPRSADMGEPVENALAEGSQFRQRLAQFDPNTTTITVWTYPDSFSDFRRVKDALYELGYLTAGRPMPQGHPIGGSPHGSRSGAQ